MTQLCWRHFVGVTAEIDERCAVVTQNACITISSPFFVYESLKSRQICVFFAQKIRYNRWVDIAATLAYHELPQACETPRSADRFAAFNWCRRRASFKTQCNHVQPISRTVRNQRISNQNVPMGCTKDPERRILLFRSATSGGSVTMPGTEQENCARRLVFRREKREALCQIRS
jgi:hypothetical protein